MRKQLGAILIIITVFPLITLAQTKTDTTEYTIDELYNYSLEELLAIKISSATKFEESIKDIPHSIQIITKEDIETYGYRTISEILQHVSGFYMVDDYNGYKQNFGVRGVLRDEWNQNIVFMVNGVRQRTFDDYNNKISLINTPVQSIERIEIIKGAVNVSYGPGAFLGAVNIVTTGNENKQNIFITAGNNNTFNAGLNLNTRKDDYKFTVNTGIGTTSGISQNLSDMGPDTNLLSNKFRQERYAYFGMTVQNKLFTSNLTFDKFNFKGPSYAPIYFNKDNLGTSSNLALRYNLGFNKEFNKNLSINSKYQYQYVQQDNEYLYIPLENTLEKQFISYGSHEFDLNIKISPGEKLISYVGFNAIYCDNYKNDIDIPLLGLSNTTVRINDPVVTYGSYLRLSYLVNNKLRFNGGLRLDKSNSFTLQRKFNLAHNYIDPDQQILDNYSTASFIYPDYDFELLPEFSVLLQPSDAHIVKLIYAKAMNKLPLFRTRDASLGIKPEFIHTFEVNHNYLISKELNLSSSVFYNYYYDIQTVTFYIEDNTQYQYASNSGKSSTFGIKTSLDYRAENNLSLFISACYTHSSNLLYKNEYPAFSPQMLATLNISHKIYNFSFALTNHFVSSTEPKYNYALSDPNDINSAPIGRVGDTAPAYVNTGINIVYWPSFIKGLSINLRVSNLLDQKMYYPVTDFNSWASKGTLGIDRTFLVGINYKF